MNGEEGKISNGFTAIHYLYRMIAGSIIGAVIGMVAGAVCVFAYDALFFGKSNDSYSTEIYFMVGLWGAFIGLPVGAIVGAIIGLIISLKKHI